MEQVNQTGNTIDQKEGSTGVDEKEGTESDCAGAKETEEEKIQPAAA